jgi:2-keto-4-pentenoate hydratase
VSDTRIQEYARLLYEAERTRVPVAPLTERDPALTVDDAYAIQLANVRRVTQMGHVISGKKIGLTSPGIQRQFGVGEPDYGHLFAAMACPSGRVPAEALLQPKIEGEVAFVLGADLPGGRVTPADVRAATEYVTAAFEIVDSRVADWKIQLVDTISDNASSGRYILGDIKLPPDCVDLSGEEMQLFKNGTLAERGVGAAVLGDPCAAVAWLANRLWTYGVTLNRGEVVLSGAFSAAPMARKGDVFEARFFTLGVVKAEFV